MTETRKARNKICEIRGTPRYIKCEINICKISDYLGQFYSSKTKEKIA